MVPLGWYSYYLLVIMFIINRTTFLKAIFVGSKTSLLFYKYEFECNISVSPLYMVCALLVLELLIVALLDFIVVITLIYIFLINCIATSLL